MPLLPPDQTRVDEFLRVIGVIENAYSQKAFYYLAVRKDDQWNVVQGRLFLATGEEAVVPFRFETRNVLAGRVPLLDLSLTPRTFIEKLASGRLETPDGVLYFQSADKSQHAVSFEPFHPEGLRTQVRLNVLSIFAGPLEPLRQPDIDWEIKSASIPYGDLQEILNDLSLGVAGEPTAKIEIVAHNVAAIDGRTSKISGTSAAIQVLLAKNLDRDSVRWHSRA